MIVFWCVCVCVCVCVCEWLEQLPVGVLLACLPSEDRDVVTAWTQESAVEAQPTGHRVRGMDWQMTAESAVSGSQRQSSHGQQRQGYQRGGTEADRQNCVCGSASRAAVCHDSVG